MHLTELCAYAICTLHMPWVETPCIKTGSVSFSAHKRIMHWSVMLHRYVHTCMYACMHSYIYVDMYIRVCLHTFIHMYYIHVLYACMHTRGEEDQRPCEIFMLKTEKKKSKSLVTLTVNLRGICIHLTIELLLLQLLRMVLDKKDTAAPLSESEEKIYR